MKNDEFFAILSHKSISLPITRSLCSMDTIKIVSIQLLLFVDDRPSSQAHIEKVAEQLQKVADGMPYDLQIIEIGEQPHLVEHFRLIATPALVKIFPEPRQTLAGSNIVQQIDRCWPRWVQAFEIYRQQERDHKTLKLNNPQEISYSSEIVRMSDEIFRLKKDKEALLDQLKFKDQILAMLAHDLRSPLTAASMAVDTLEIADNQEESTRIQKLKIQLYQQAKKQFKLMNRLITDILQASKTINSQLNLNHSKVLMQDLCEDILYQLTGQFKAKNLTINRDIPQDLHSIYADEEMIRQVVVNLLENAIKYTPESGTISLSILHRTTQKIQVSICDTGPGIPKEKQERIFEGHFRLQRDESKEGYGLGLSLCRKIVQAHYGHIWVDSLMNRGSCFHFTLPVYR